MLSAIRVISAALVITSVFSTSTISLFARQMLPACAATCQANADLAGCSPTNDTCLCNSQEFVLSTATCIQQSCSGADLTNADLAAQELCEEVGVTLTASSYIITFTGGTVQSSPTSASTTAPAPTTSTSSAISNNVGALAMSSIALGFAVLAL